MSDTPKPEETSQPVPAAPQQQPPPPPFDPDEQLIVEFKYTRTDDDSTTIDL